MEGVTPLRYSVVPFADKGSVLGVAVSVRPLAVKGTPFAVCSKGYTRYLDVYLWDDTTKPQ